MFNHITHDKVEEVVRLAERARTAPDSDSAERRPPGEHNPPVRPQPASDWAHAFPDYLRQLPDEALAELVALYRSAAGDAESLEAALQAERDRADGKEAHIDYLTSRPDLPAVLRAAYMPR